MKTDYFYNIEQNTDEWLELRRGILTASQVKDILTPKGKLAKNEKARAIVFRLLSERVTDSKDEEFSNSDMDRGNMYETPARDIYSKEYDTVTECGFVTRELENGVVGYSPDGLVGDNGLIEIKCPRIAKHISMIAKDEVPDEYMAQIQAGLFVTGREWCDFISYFDTEYMFVKRVTVDPDWQDNISTAALSLNDTVNEYQDAYQSKVTTLVKTERAFEELADMGDNYYG